MFTTEYLDRDRSGGRKAAGMAVDTHEGKKLGSAGLRWSLVASDLVALSSAWAVACSFGLNYGGRVQELVAFGVLVVAITLGLFVTNRLYLARMCSVRALETAAVLRACVLGGALAWFVAGRISITTVRIRAVAVSQLLAVVLVFGGRALFRLALRRARSTGRHARPVVLIGGGEEVFELHTMLSTDPELGYEVMGAIGRQGEISAWAPGLTYLGPLDSAVQGMKNSGAGAPSWRCLACRFVT